MANRYFVFSTVVSLLCFLVSGCGADPLSSSQAALRGANKSNIDRLHGCYSGFMSANNNRGPEDEEEFKAFIKSPKVIGRLEKILGVKPSEVDDMFICERDGKPFRIKYGVQGVFDHAVIYEEEGVDGMRYVALTAPKLVDADEYEGHWSGRIKPKAPTEMGMSMEESLQNIE